MRKSCGIYVSLKGAGVSSFKEPFKSGAHFLKIYLFQDTQLMALSSGLQPDAWEFKGPVLILSCSCTLSDKDLRLFLISASATPLSWGLQLHHFHHWGLYPSQLLHVWPLISMLLLDGRRWIWTSYHYLFSTYIWLNYWKLMSILLLELIYFVQM